MTTNPRHHVWVFYPIEPDYDVMAAKAFLTTDLLAFMGSADNLPDLLWNWDREHNCLSLHAMVFDPENSEPHA